MAQQVDVNSYLDFGSPTPPSGKLFTGFGPGQQATSPLTQMLTGGKDLTQYSPFTPQFDTASNLMNGFYNWTQDQVNAFRAQMGLINTAYLTAPVYDPNGAFTGGTGSLQAAWAGLVQAAQNSTSAGKSMSPWDILSSDVSAMGGKGKAGTTQDKTIVQTTQTSAPDANALFTAAAQSLLGRAPTAEELGAFRNNLSGLEAANPITRVQEISYTPQGYPIMNDKSVTGGVSDQAKQNLALQQAKANPEYGAYQAATTYMGALQELLSGGKV